MDTLLCINSLNFAADLCAHLTMTRSQLVANAAIIALLICMGLRSEYMQDLSSDLLFVSEKGMPLSDVNEEIRALHKQVDNLQKRCVAK